MQRGISTLSISALSAVILSGASIAWGQGQLNKLTPAEAAAGWELLFDGVDKQAHWRSGEMGTTNTWAIEDSALASVGDEKFLFTRQSYENFEWKFDFRVNKGGNSGAFPRVNPEIGWFCSAMEYGILDDENGGDRNDMSKTPGQTHMPVRRSAAAYDFYPTTRDGHNDSPFVSLAKPHGQYNSGIIVANGKFMEHWLNGEKVVDFEVGSTDWQQRFERSKFWTQCSARRTTYGKHASGLLGFQDHGHGLDVWIRNVKVRPFTFGSKLPKPWIDTLAATGGAYEVKLDAAVTGATIRYTLDGTVPTETSPKYTAPFQAAAGQVVKAKSWRARFQASDEAELTVAGTSSLQRISFTRQTGSVNIVGKSLRVSLPAADSWKVDVFSSEGRLVESMQITGARAEWEPKGLQRGIHHLVARSATTVVTASFAWLDTGR